MKPPRDMPPAGIVADMCAIRQWDENLDSDTRLLFEMASDTIRAQTVDRIKAINRAEHLEAEVATYAALLYGPNQKGGAA